LCSLPNTTADIDNVINWVTGGLSTTAMVNYPYATTFLADLPANPVNVTCDRATQLIHPTTPYDYMISLASANSVFYNYSANQTCQNFSVEND